MPYNLANKLFDNYNIFREPKFTQRLFHYSTVKNCIENHKQNKIVCISELGKSLENREIFLLKYGNGPIKILIWSQMHGDEPTATQALFDIFNLLSHKNKYQEIKTILENCTLYFVPLVNPDGNELYQRRNAQDIDLNRDAQRLVATESQILMNIRNEIKPDFGFNLHDQTWDYAAGNTNKPATISFLSPTFNFEKSVNESRIKSMQVISVMNKILQNYIPQSVGKYSDDYLPAAFGDTFQQKGTSTILIESGGFPNDPEKQFVRKLNFVIIASALYSIAINSFVEQKKEDYDNIPFNKKNKLFDYLIREVKIETKEQIIVADVGIRKFEKKIPGTLNFNSYFFIDDIGDLSQYNGYIELNASKLPVFKNINIGTNADNIISSLSYLSI